MAPSLILASTSPRRKELLSLLGIPFDIVDPGFVEQVAERLAPEEQARRFADGKARTCAARFPDRLVLGSDTLIALEGQALGKPADAEEARCMLDRLRGREHLIHTAVALRRHTDALHQDAVETVRVWMEAFTDAELDAYVRAGESLGKAGAYSIQGLGGRLIRKIEGDYTAAVGLPLRMTAGLLHACGVALPIDLDELYRGKPYPNWAGFAS